MTDRPDNPRVHVEVRTADEVRGELETIYDRWPSLRNVRGHCCGGCASQHVASLHGWGDATDAWERVEELRYLLGEER